MGGFLNLKKFSNPYFRVWIPNNPKLTSSKAKN